MTEKRSRFFLLWSLCLGVASLCVLGFALLLSSGLLASPVGAHTPEDAAPAVAEPGAICFGYVDLERGCSALAPLQPGRVAAVLVKENEQVEAGTPLLRLADDAPRLRAAEARAARASARTEVAQARQEPERHKIRLALQRSALDAVENRLASARLQLERKKELQGSALANATEVSAADEEVKQVESLREVERNRLADLEKNDPQIALGRAEAELEVVQTRLAQAEQALEECVLKAPEAGRVVRILVAPGDVLSVPARQPAMQFAADEARIIRAEVEQEYASRVKAGQAVRVLDEAGTLICRGTVRRVSDWFLQRRTIFQEPNRFNDSRTLECIIDLDSSHPHLRIGQRFRLLIGVDS